MHRSKWFVGVLSLLAPRLSSQNVHVVDGIQHATIGSAFAVAAPDDVILLRLPSLPGFQVSGKGVVIRSEGGTVIRGASSVRNLPSRQTMVIEGLTFTVPNQSTALTLGACAGAVALRRLVVQADAIWGNYFDQHGTGISGLEIDGCASVDVSQCTFAAGHSSRTGTLSTGPYGCVYDAGSGIKIRNSRVSLFECVASGGNGLNATLGWVHLCQNGAGLAAEGSVINAIGCQFRAGSVFWFSGDGIALSASTANLSGCDVDGGVGDPSSQFRLYGANSGWYWPVPTFQSTRRLPELRQQISGNDLIFDSRYAPPHSVLFLAFSSRPSYFDFTPHGSHAALLLLFDHTSGLLISAANDRSGNARLTVPLSPAFVATIGRREIFLQGLSSSSGGPWMCSNLVGFHLQ
jgi:hypothetical protein